MFKIGFFSNITDTGLVFDPGFASGGNPPDIPSQENKWYTELISGSVFNFVGGAFVVQVPIDQGGDANVYQWRSTPIDTTKTYDLSLDLNVDGVPSRGIIIVINSNFGQIDNQYISLDISAHSNGTYTNTINPGDWTSGSAPFNPASAENTFYIYAYLDGTGLASTQQIVLDNFTFVEN